MAQQAISILEYVCITYKKLKVFGTLQIKYTFTKKITLNFTLDLQPRDVWRSPAADTRSIHVYPVNVTADVSLNEAQYYADIQNLPDKLNSRNPFQGL